jgi:hypothetical protein
MADSPMANLGGRERQRRPAARPPCGGVALLAERGHGRLLLPAAAGRARIKK